jgi:hypothetical protein
MMFCQQQIRVLAFKDLGGLGRNERELKKLVYQ